MTRAELKKEAKESLKGRWGTAIGMVLLYEIILSGISMLAGLIPGIGSIAVMVISVPLSFGFIGQMMKFARKEEVGICDYFSIGFKNFAKSWSIFGNTLLKLLWIIIPVIIVGVIGAIVFAVALGIFLGVTFGGVTGAQLSQAEGLIGNFMLASLIFMCIFTVLYVILLVKSYFYILTSYIGNDNLAMSGKEVVEKSKMLMKGHRWEYFVLSLSFIGWILLSILTFGIGLLWLMPYIEVTNIKFYEYVLADSENGNVEVIVNN